MGEYASRGVLLVAWPPPGMYERVRSRQACCNTELHESAPEQMDMNIAARTCQKSITYILRLIHHRRKHHLRTTQAFVKCSAMELRY